MSTTAILVTLVVAALAAVAAYAVGLLAGRQQGEASATESAEQLREQLRTMTADAVTASRSSVLELADSRVKATELLMQPVKESIARLDGQLDRIARQSASWQAELKTQVESVRVSGSELQRQTRQLAEALRKPQVRGHWGEMQLKRTLELAGVTSRCVFDEQVTRQTDDGGLRPDVVVNLPGGKSVVIDAKVPLDAFLAAGDADDPERRDAELARHARQVKAHVDALSAKAYWKQFTPTPEFVVMFVPGEAIFAQAAETDPGLIDYAADKKVMLATPTTLIAMLKTVAYAWSQEEVAENAREVQRIGSELYDRLCTVGGHIDKLGRALTTSVDGYNKMVGSIEGRVLVTARRMRDLRVTDDELEQPKEVSALPRTISAPELVADAELPVSVIEGEAGREQWVRRAAGE